MFIYFARTTETHRLTTETCTPAQKRMLTGIYPFEYRSNPFGLNLANLRSGPAKDQCQPIPRSAENLT